jgi:hypothetical protein
LRAAIRCALPAPLFAAGLVLVVAGSPGLGWALLVFGLVAASLCWPAAGGSADDRSRAR